jgi:uncharacterized protein with von Willebrand factor type A (vWA) domain
MANTRDILDQQGRIKWVEAIGGSRWVAKPGDGSWRFVNDRGGQIAVLPNDDFELFGRDMLTAYAKGETFTPPTTKKIGGELVPARGVDARRRELLTHGRDATRTVPDFTRHLAATEFDAGGVFQAAVRSHDQEQWPAFTRELFASLYGDPEPTAAPAAADGWIGKLLECAEATNEWAALRRQCSGDPWAAGIGAGRVAAKLEPEVGKTINQLPAADPVRQEREAAELEELGAGLGASLRNDAAVGADDADTVERVLEKLARQVRAAVREAADEAAEEVESMQVALGALGAGGAPGVLGRVNAPRGAVRRALEQNDRLRRIAAVAGRMRARARAKQRTRVRYVPEQVVDVTLGAEISRLLPSETMLLADEASELLLVRRLLERQALEYRLEGHETQDLGPVVYCVDGSESMRGAPHEWAMGVALGLIEICAAQRRPFVLVHFDSQVQRSWNVEDPTRLSLDELTDMVCYFSGGGTCYAPPLQEAARVLQEKTFRRADVVLLSDGAPADKPFAYHRIADELKAAGASIYGVSLGAKFRAVDEPIFAGVAHVADLSSDGELELVFGI